MAIRREHVVLKLDVSGFTQAMAKASRMTGRLGLLVAAMKELGRALQPKHHRRELPARSAMHAAYDRRRRARRRRARR